MGNTSLFWQVWAQNLHRWGAGEIVATLLESAGPLAFISAQMVYVSQPLLDQAFSHSTVDALAHLLEEPDETRAFAAFLRQNPRGVCD